MRVCLHKHFGLAQGDTSDTNIPVLPQHQSCFTSKSSLRAHTVLPKWNKTRRWAPAVKELPDSGARLELSGTSPPAGTHLMQQIHSTNSLLIS